MTKGLMAVALVAGLTFAGCNSEKPADDGKGKIEINAPGTNITIDPDKGVEIDAPGTKVKSDTEGNTSVEAPGTDVEVKNE